MRAARRRHAPDLRHQPTFHADSVSVDPAGNQVEHAGRSQVNVIRSGNSGIARIALNNRREGSGFHRSHYPKMACQWRDAAEAQSSAWSSKSGQAAMSTPWFSGDASVHQLGACAPSARRPPASSTAATLASA